MEAPRFWRLEKVKYRLIGEICPNPECQEKIFPPRDICPKCGEITFINGNGEPKKGEIYNSGFKVRVPAPVEPIPNSQEIFEQMEQVHVS